MFYEDLKEYVRSTSEEFDLVAKVTQHPERPRPIRSIDQIYMLIGSQLNQAKLISDYLRGRSVAFLGDGDCMSLVLGILAKEGKGIINPPSYMVVLDFDERILNFITKTSRYFGFHELIEVHRYNVRDPIPENLIEQSDLFYTNPPFGSKNEGKSGIIFLARCMELCKQIGSWGITLLPFHHHESWSRTAMLNIQDFLVRYGYVVSEMLRGMHSYHLDDNPRLLSGTLVLDRIKYVEPPYRGKVIPYNELKSFYGSAQKNFPDYINKQGKFIYSNGHNVL